MNLSTRLCDLKPVLRGSRIEKIVLKVRAELRAKGLGFQPHFWFSTEWFSADGVPGVAIPFYLANSRYLALEKKMIGFAEGECREEALRILRHEVGHAIEVAYGLRRKKLRQRVFGRTTVPYPTHYKPKRGSRRFVRNLPGDYAQAHPDEDFAETFAVWLDSSSDWRRKYAGQPALKKLLAMEELMDEIRGQAPKPEPLEMIRQKVEVDPLPSLTSTLKQHYARKRRRWRVDDGGWMDREIIPYLRRRSTTVARRARVVNRLAKRTGFPRTSVEKLTQLVVKRAQVLSPGLKLPRGTFYPEWERIVERNIARFVRRQETIPI